MKNNIWHPASEKAPDGAIVAVIDRHWKKKGWLSIDMDFGEVAHHSENDTWWVGNNDDRGGGGETWSPANDENRYNGWTFDFWCFVTDLPALPEWK